MRTFRSVVALLAAVASFNTLPAQDFRRGDANADGAVDLSDGSRTLGHLFLGREVPPCRDAADADDSGELELTDAVFTFSHLFLGRAAPPSPGPATCGSDPTADDLDCAVYPLCEASPSTTFVVGGAGGTFTTDSGIALTFPAGAVAEDVEITISPLSDGIEESLNTGPSERSHTMRLLAGFAASPDGLVFPEPVRVRIPVEPLRPGGIPVPVSFDPETSVTTIEASTVQWFGEEGFVEYEIFHFSEPALTEVISEDGQFQMAEGSEVPPDAPCRAVQVTVVNSAEDRSVATTSTDCQAISDFLLVVLDACGGQQERHLISEWNCEIQLDATQQDNSIPVAHDTRFTARAVFTEFPDIEVRLPLLWQNRIPETASLVTESDGFVTGAAVLTGKEPGGAAVRVSVPKPPLSLELGVLITSLRLEPVKEEVAAPLGKAVPLLVRAFDATDGEVECPLRWKSADPTIATVDAQGVVLGQEIGTTEVRAHPTDPDGCPDGCATIVVEVIRNFEGVWETPQTLAIELPGEEGPPLGGECNLTNRMAVHQNGREGCGEFSTEGTCTIEIPDSEPIVVEIDESGYLAGVLAEDDTFSYCTQRSDELEFCFHSSGSFASDDRVTGMVGCREYDEDDALLSRTTGSFEGTRTQTEVPEGIGCLEGISGAEAVALCPRDG